MQKVHTFERSIIYKEVTTIDPDLVPEIYDELRLTQGHTQCFTLHKPSWQ